MPKITAITMQEKNKKKCNLFLDGEFYAGVFVESVLKNRLKVGMEIDQQDLADLMFESDKIIALQKSVDYTTKHLKTKRQVITYLQGKGFSNDVVFYCIDKLIEYKLIDDKEFAKRYIESTANKQGKHLTQFMLANKGVKKEDVSAVYDELDIDSRGNALIVAKKHIKNKELTNENKTKTFRYLIGRGFSYEDANYAISNLGGEEQCNEF